MTKKFEIEVFKDYQFPELDSDVIAHALAVVDIIKPFVEIINRGRKLKVDESHGDKDIRVVNGFNVRLDVDTGVLYTNRHIDDDTHSYIAGIFIRDTNLCIVSTETDDVQGTARHEIGHALYSHGLLPTSADPKTGHCLDDNCLMYHSVKSERQKIKSKGVRRISERLGVLPELYESVIVPKEFCPHCEEALGKSAYIASLFKQNPALASVVRNGLLKSS